MQISDGTKLNAADVAAEAIATNLRSCGFEVEVQTAGALATRRVRITNPMQPGSAPGYLLVKVSEERG